MHSIDDKYPTRPGFEHSTTEFEPQQDRMAPTIEHGGHAKQQ